MLSIGFVLITAAEEGVSKDVRPKEPADQLNNAYALVIGSNQSGPNQVPLRYAHRDAENMKEVLHQIAYYPENQIETLVDPSAEMIADSLRRIGAHIERLSRREEQSIFFFYYSGHARSQSLTLGKEELRLDELRKALSAIKADVKIVVLDACQTGAYSQIKGARLEADFSYNSVSLLQTGGTAVMASSAADELSQESDKLKGSFFTHHLTVGLRGAADRDDDGRISLYEAYDYAYNRTLIDTAGTSVGAQHVTLETDLKGKGEMILSWPEKAEAKLQLPAELDAKVIIFDTDTQKVQAEVVKTKGADVTLAFPPGNYAAILNKSDGQFRCPAILEEEKTAVLDLSACVPFEMTVVTVKAEPPSLPNESLSPNEVPPSTDKAPPSTDKAPSTAESGEVENQPEPTPSSESRKTDHPGLQAVGEEHSSDREKKKLFIWAPFLEVSLGLFINDHNDDFSHVLEDLQYNEMAVSGEALLWSVTVGVSILRYVGAAFLYSSLDKNLYEGEQHDSYSGDDFTNSISWQSFRLGGQVRGSFPLFHDWFTPFVSVGLGGTCVAKEYEYRFNASDFHDGSYEPTGASGSGGESSWHFTVFGGIGLAVKIYRVLGLVSQGEYVYAPGLKMDGKTHNHGGWVLSTGLRFSL